MSNKPDALQARKELLMMKAELERMEIGAHADAVRKQFAWVNVFRRFGGWLGPRNLGALGLLAQKYPLVGMVTSTVLLRFRQPIVKLALRAGLGAVALAAGAYWLQSRKRKAAEPIQVTGPSGS